ncbi:hypothetical protein J6590_076903 [Homalodisca vitripennis]|nr:hypothetical protein J6590_076903 [Homalodisca vitripennis]
MAECNFHPDHLSASEFLARPCCEVLIAGTNDLAVGEQRNIYRHLEGYIAAGASNKVIILPTLPHHHDLNLTHPVHYQTVLVNAYIKELAARHNLRVLNFDDIGRRYFTRHGQHLSWRGKRLLVDMIVAAMGPATQGPGMTAQPRFQGNHRTMASNTANLTSPAAARGESATTRQRPASVQDISYADAVRRSPRPDILQIKGCSANLKENSVPYDYSTKTPQYATNKLDDIQLMCEELKSGILVITENGFNNENLELCKIPNSKLAEAYCRQTSKGDKIFTKFPIKVTTAKNLEAAGIKYKLTGQH